MADDMEVTTEDVVDLLEQALARLNATEKIFGLVMLTISHHHPEAFDELIQGLDSLAVAARREELHAIEVEAYERQATVMRSFVKASSRADTQLGDSQPTPAEAQPATTAPHKEGSKRGPKIH